MHKKYDNILEVYGKEVNKMRELFQKNSTLPPISKGKPPSSGAISWSESIFKRI